MEPIEPIGIPNITIPQVVQRDWIYGIPFVPNNDPPVTLQLGFPIVDMPGCVTMHKDNKDHVTELPFDKDLVNQDEKGSTTLCPNGQYPTYNAMDYQPEDLIIQRDVPPPPIAPPPEVEAPPVPDTGDIGGGIMKSIPSFTGPAAPVNPKADAPSIPTSPIPEGTGLGIPSF